METDTWLNDLSILWKDGNWMKVVPHQDMTDAEKANSIARLSLLVGIVGVPFKSYLLVGLSLLGIIMSAQIAKRVSRNNSNSTNKKLLDAKGSAKGAQASRTQGRSGGSGGSTGINSKPSTFAPPSTFNMKAAGQQNPGFMEGQISPTEYQNRSMYVRAEDYMSAAGWPTELGPAPTPFVSPAGSRTRPYAEQEANYAYPRGQFQTMQNEPTNNGQVSYGAFASDGGNTSTPITPPIPTGTIGSNFASFNDTYRPKQLAPFSPLNPNVNPNNDATCFPAPAENPLGNPTIDENRVARPKLCTTIDPRDDSNKFLSGLYESTSTQAAGYSFFPFPVQDIVDGRDKFQEFVISGPMTHYKDKYSNPENAGIYNITDLAGPLGY